MENEILLKTATAIATYLVGGVLWVWYAYRQRTGVEVEEEIRFYQVKFLGAFLLWVVWMLCVSYIRILVWWRVHQLRKHF